mmetsp:Transcript_1896/g.4795  ORF Transcript_1896/g.4795 Transcript_1896/m.4795 type:complete len:253 (-) Transcript_1896:2-760(-)
MRGSGRRLRRRLVVRRPGAQYRRFLRDDRREPRRPRPAMLELVGDPAQRRTRDVARRRRRPDVHRDALCEQFVYLGTTESAHLSPRPPKRNRRRRRRRNRNHVNGHQRTVLRPRRPPRRHGLLRFRPRVDHPRSEPPSLPPPRLSRPGRHARRLWQPRGGPVLRRHLCTRRRLPRPLPRRRLWRARHAPLSLPRPRRRRCHDLDQRHPKPRPRRRSNAPPAHDRRRPGHLRRRRPRPSMIMTFAASGSRGRV